MSTRPGSALARSVTCRRWSGRAHGARESHRRRAILVLAEKVEGVKNLAGARLRGGIIKRDDEIALRRRAQAPRDDLPGFQIVGQRKHAEIMAERRPEPRRRRHHGADAGNDADVQSRARRDRRFPEPRKPPPPCRTRRRRRPKPPRPCGPPAPVPAHGSRAKSRRDCRSGSAPARRVPARDRYRACSRSARRPAPEPSLASGTSQHSGPGPSPMMNSAPLHLAFMAAAPVR